MTSRSDEIAKAINKAMGEGTIILGSDPSLVVEYLPTGCLPFDVLLGGGLPRGRTVEVFGGFSVLKSYMALKALATTQKAGGTCALIDTEHAYDPLWAEALGVDIDSLIVQHPDTGEEAVAVTTTLLKNNIDLIVWDSVAAAFPQAYAEAKPGKDKQPGRLAAMMSKGLARMTASNTSTAMLFINQTRESIGMSFGPREKPPGGRALPFYASLRLRLTRVGRITKDVQMDDTEKSVSGKETVGYKIKGDLEKSKLNRPHREVYFQYSLEEEAIDEIGFLIAQGLETGLITQPSKAWYTIPEVMEGKLHGRPKLRAWIEGDEEVQQWLAEEIAKTHLTVTKTP